MALSLTHKANIDISPGSSVSPVINVSQYDAGSTIELTVYDDGVLMNTDGLQAIVCGRKADRKVFLYSVVCGAHTATITTTNQMTAVDGDALCEVRFIDVFTGQNIGTANFILAVEESPIKYTGDFSESDIPSIIDIDRAVAAASAIQNMEVSASTLPAGSEATVTKVQDLGHVSLDFGIPTGPIGPQGPIGDVPVVELTAAQYDALSAEEKQANVLYCVTDGVPENAVAIPSGADLNDYTIPGTYYVPDATTSATIVHTPMSGSYTLRVEVLGGSWVHQTATRADSDITTTFSRVLYPGPSPVWSQWRAYSGFFELRLHSTETTYSLTETPTQWGLNASLAGYRPLTIASIGCNDSTLNVIFNSGSVSFANNEVSISGTARTLSGTISAQFYAYVVWERIL